jgi:hypothetical protein
MRHLATDDVGVLGEDAVGFGCDHYAVGYARVVVAITPLVRCESISAHGYMH